MALVTSDSIVCQGNNGMSLDYSLNVGKFILTMRRGENRADTCVLGEEQIDYAEKLSNLFLAQTVLSGVGEVKIYDATGQGHVFIAEKVENGILLIHRTSGEPNSWNIVITTEQIAGLILSIRNAFEIS